MKNTFTFIQCQSPVINTIYNIPGDLLIQNLLCIQPEDDQNSMNIKESLTECNGKSITIQTKITSIFGHATRTVKR